MNNNLYKKLCHMDTLKRAWHLVRNDAKNDFIHDAYKYSDFGLALEENLKGIREDLLCEKYYPKPLLEIDVPKSSLAVRPGSVPEIEDRIVTFAITYLIAPYLDKKLPEGVYSYRLKPDEVTDRLFRDHEILKYPFLKKKTIQDRIDIVESWYAQWPLFIEKSIFAYEQEGYRYLAISDVVSYFENIDLDILRDEILLKHLPSEQKIINLLMHILEYWTWRSCEGKPVLRGIPQGNEVSSFLGNIYLLPLDEEIIKSSKQKDIKYLRYMDDVKIFTKDEATARECIFVMNDILRKLHLNIQGEKTLILKDEDIRDELDDERLTRVNEIIKLFEHQKRLTNNEKRAYVKELKQQYRKIKARKRPLSGKDLRLFRRLITGFALLRDPYLVPRALNEIQRNPDNRLMDTVVKYLKYFPNKEIITKKLIAFLSSPVNNFALQEAQVLRILRYTRSFPRELISYTQRIIKQSSQKHWYVRVQAILLLSQLELSRAELRTLEHQYKSEKNVEVKKALYKPLCQLDKDALDKLLTESIFDKNRKITQIIKMLIQFECNKEAAFDTMNSLFNNHDECTLIDEFYKVEVIKFNSDNDVRDILLKRLKVRRRETKRPILLKKINRVIRYLSELKRQEQSRRQ